MHQTSLKHPIKLFWALILISVVSCKQKQHSPTVYLPENVNVDTLPFFYYIDKHDKHIKGEHIKVNVKIQGEKYEFLFDTGASSTFVNQALPIESSANHTIINWKDIHDNVYSDSLVSIDTVRVGKMKAIGLDNYLEGEIRADGILGGNILRRFAWKLDFTNRKIYVARDAKSLGADPEKGIALEIRNGCPYVKCMINGKTVLFLIDTGNPGLAVSIDDKYNGTKQAVVWHRMRRPIGLFNPEKNIDPSTVDTSYYISGDIAIGGRVIKDELVGFEKHKIGSILGLDFLKRFKHVIIDYPNRKLYLGEGTYKSLPFLERVTKTMNGMGLSIDVMDSTAIVDGLTPRAKEKGFRLGDTVSGIDGVSFLNRPLSFFMEKPEKVTLYRNGIAKDTIIDLLSEFHRQLMKSCNKKDNALVGIKRKESVHNIKLKRNYHFTAMPDTVQSPPFWAINSAYKNLYEGQIYGIKDSSSRPIKFLYIPKKLPAHVLENAQK